MTDSRTLLIIPTKNEHQTIHRVMEEVVALGIEDLHVLVVDDDSIDGTWRTYGTRWAADSEHHHLLRRCGPQKGRGYALREAYQWALDHEPGYDFVLEMAGNTTDDPSVLQSMQEALSSGSDVVIAEREQGGEPSTEGPRRTQALARMATGAPVHDIESGFRGYRREVLEAILPRLKATSHGIKAEVLAAATRRGFTVTGVPVASRLLPDDGYAQGGNASPLQLLTLWVRRLFGLV